MSYGVEFSEIIGRKRHCCQWLVALCLSDCVKCFMNMLLFSSYIPDLHVYYLEFITLLVCALSIFPLAFN